MLTQEIVRRLFHYDPETGIFTHANNGNKMRSQWIGKVAGNRVPKGYWKLWVVDRNYLAHVIAWLYMTGEWPQHQIDHQDRDKANNAWKNLRPATNKQNQENAPPNKRNKSGYRGVWWRSEVGKWRALIRHNDKLHSLGYFTRKEDAIAARFAAERRLFTHSPACLATLAETLEGSTT